MQGTSLEGSVHSAQSTEYRAQITEHSAQCTEYSAQCTVHSAQCTVAGTRLAVADNGRLVPTQFPPLVSPEPSDRSVIGGGGSAPSHLTPDQHLNTGGPWYLQGLQI